MGPSFLPPQHRPPHVRRLNPPFTGRTAGSSCPQDIPLEHGRGPRRNSHAPLSSSLQFSQQSAKAFDLLPFLSSPKSYERPRVYRRLYSLRGWEAGRPVVVVRHGSLALSARAPGRFTAWLPLPSWIWTSEVSSDHLPERRDVQHCLRQQPLQLGVLLRSKTNL